MKFVLVNDRSPRSSSICAHCSKAMGAGYLRDLASKQPYCNYGCYRPRKTTPIAAKAPVHVPICTEQSVQ